MEIKLKRTGHIVTIKDFLTQNAMEAASEAMRAIAAEVVMSVTDDEILETLGIEEFNVYLQARPKDKDAYKNRVRRILSEKNMKATITAADVNRSNRAKAVVMVTDIEDGKEHGVWTKEEIDEYLGDLPSSDYMQIINALSDLEEDESERGKD